MNKPIIKCVYDSTYRGMKAKGQTGHALNKPPRTCVSHLGQVICTETITITCKYCGSKNVVKYGKKDGYQYYLCKDCGHTFAWNNAMPGMRYPPEEIAAAINMFYDGLSIDAIRRQLQS